jgi:hypothetical protein
MKHNELFRNCSSCPISKAIESGELQGKAYEDLPCSSCPASTETYNVCGHGRLVSYDELAETSLVSSISTTTNIIDSNSNQPLQDKRDYAGEVLHHILTLEPLQLLVLRAYYNGKSYAQMANEYRDIGLDLSKTTWFNIGERLATVSIPIANTIKIIRGSNNGL